MKRTRITLTVAATAAVVALAGCGGGGNDRDGDGDGGGGGGGGGTAASEVPASALKSSEGLIAFMRDLIANRTDETSEPIALGDAVLPTSETLEPLPVR